MCHLYSPHVSSLLAFASMHHSILFSLLFYFFFLMIRRPPRSTPFPTRRSSDLAPISAPESAHQSSHVTRRTHHIPVYLVDRKSTRLNSSHLGISYAVFCLKKKKKNKQKSK